MSGISNGQLLQMDKDKQIEAISKLSVKARMQLALIASLGAAKCLEKSKEYKLMGMEKNSEERIHHAHELITLASALIPQD